MRSWSAARTPRASCRRAATPPSASQTPLAGAWAAHWPSSPEASGPAPRQPPTTTLSNNPPSTEKTKQGVRHSERDGDAERYTQGHGDGKRANEGDIRRQQVESRRHRQQERGGNGIMKGLRQRAGGMVCGRGGGAHNDGRRPAHGPARGAVHAARALLDGKVLRRLTVHCPRAPTTTTSSHRSHPSTLTRETLQTALFSS